MPETLAVAVVALVGGGVLVGAVIALLTMASHWQATRTRPADSLPDVPPDASVDVDVPPPPVTDPLDVRWTLPDERVSPLYFQGLTLPAAFNLESPTDIFPRDWMDAAS